MRDQSPSEVLTPINAVTATTTSAAIPIDNVSGVTWIFTRAAHSAGSSTFTVTVSLDGTTYVAYNKLIDNVANTNAQNLTRVASKVLSADGSAILYMDLEKESFKYMKVVATEATDGTHTAQCILTYR